MKIIKAGDINRMQALRRFSCDYCGCVFEADRTEYRTEQSRMFPEKNGVMICATGAQSS